MLNRASVVEALEEIGLLLELAGENPFKVRAYTNGARVLEGLSDPLDQMLASGELKKVKGIGAGLLADITALLQTGSSPTLVALEAAIPPGLRELGEIPGLGPKKLQAVREGLGINSVGELEYAIGENRLIDLPGFGAKTQAKLGESVAAWKRNRGKRLLSDVLEPAEALAAFVAKSPGVAQAALAGDLRRRTEIVDAVVLVVAATSADALAAVAAAPGVEITADGPRFAGALPVRVVSCTASGFGAALALATGDAAFVQGLVAAAKAGGFTLDGDGLRLVDKLIMTPDEATLFATLAVPDVTPELRDVDAPAANAGLTLIREQDLQGAFHVHTTYSDGSATIRDMALAARKLGWSYIGISDHSEAAFYAKGLSRQRIAEQKAEIAALNAELAGAITILHGVEADILQDGRLDYDDETLAGLDFVIGSVHSRFGQDREAMTSRLVRALENPRLTMLGHMTGRLLLSREPYDFDLDLVLATAAKHGKAIELNANPHRLDMDWRVLHRARKLGIAIAVNPDAHSPDGLADVRWGIEMARKGGLTADDVMNTLPLEKVLAKFA